MKDVITVVMIMMIRMIVVRFVCCLFLLFGFVCFVSECGSIVTGLFHEYMDREAAEHTYRD